MGAKAFAAGFCSQISSCLRCIECSKGKAGTVPPCRLQGGSSLIGLSLLRLFEKLALLWCNRRHRVHVSLRGSRSPEAVARQLLIPRASQRLIAFTYQRLVAFPDLF